MPDPDYKYPVLARKLAATTVSHICGFASIDLFLRKRTPPEVAPIWHEFSEYIMNRLFALGDDPRTLM